MNWTAEQVLALIEEYRKYPCLCAVKHSLYHNKMARAEALQNVKDSLLAYRPGLKTDEIKSKFNSLRTTYLAEKRKYEKAKKSGAGRDFVYEPSLWYYNQMTFINEHVVIRQSVSNIEPPSNDSEQSEEIGNSEGNSLDVETDREILQTNHNIEIIEESEDMGTETEMTDQMNSTPTNSSSQTPIGGKRKKAVNDDQIIMRDASNALKEISNLLVNPPPPVNPAVQMSSMTQEDIFGQLVSSRLKLIKNQRYRLEVQKKIDDFLYNYLISNDED